ncbi:MAG: hypothetical protein AB7O98_15730 [Hyphomonadaceae bacterium]
MADWAWIASIVAVPTLLMLWPTIYALIKRRWLRGMAYFCLTLPVLLITLNAHHWWGPVDPEDDFSPLKNGLYYNVLNWPLLTGVLWTITAVSDALLASKSDGRP